MPGITRGLGQLDTWSNPHITSWLHTLSGLRKEKVMGYSHTLHCNALRTFRLEPRRAMSRSVVHRAAFIPGQWYQGWTSQGSAKARQV